MKFLVIPLMLALCACSLINPPPKEETLALRLATEKLGEAKEKTFALQAETLKAFRDELLARALGEIEQARQDELHKLSAPTETVAADGTKTYTPHVLTTAEVEGINKTASALTTAAIKHVMDAYEVGMNIQAQKDFNDVFVALSGYWLTRLSEDEQKAAIAEKVTALFKKPSAPAPTTGGK